MKINDWILHDNDDDKDENKRVKNTWNWSCAQNSRFFEEKFLILLIIPIQKKKYDEEVKKANELCFCHLNNELFSYSVAYIIFLTNIISSFYVFRFVISTNLPSLFINKFSTAFGCAFIADIICEFVVLA